MTWKMMGPRPLLCASWSSVGCLLTVAFVMLLGMVPCIIHCNVSLESNEEEAVNSLLANESAGLGDSLDFIEEALASLGLAVEATAYHHVFNKGEGERIMPLAPPIDEHAENLGREKYLQAKQLFEELDAFFSPTLYERAVAILKEAADVYAYPTAMERLGEMYLLGQYTSCCDVDLAAKYFEALVAIDPAPRAHFYLAWMEDEGILHSGDDKCPERVLLHLLAAAELNDPLAQMALGFKFLHGLNIAADLDKAGLCYFRLASQVVKLPEFHIYPGRIYPTFNLNDETEPVLIIQRGLPPLLTQESLRYYELVGKSDPDILVMLGQLYYFGSNGLPQSYDLARQYYEQAAQSGNPSAIGLLGFMYLFGYGLDTQEPDYEMAKQLFDQCLEGELNPSPVCLTGSGLIHLHGLGVKHKIDKGVLDLVQAMAYGSIEAAFQLARYKVVFSHLGSLVGTPLMDIAVNNNHIQALFETAKLSYVSSTSASPDAVAKFKKICERGHGYLLHDAWLSYKGGFVERSLVQYSIASFCGFQLAQENAAYILSNSRLFFASDPDSSSKHLLRAFLYWNRAAIQGSNFARLKLADYYYYGMAGLPSDFFIAAENYRIAESERDSQAAFNLGYMHEHGLGVSRDLHLAKRFYNEAATFDPKSFLPSTLAATKVSVQIMWECSWIDAIYALIPSFPELPSFGAIFGWNEEQEDLPEMHSDPVDRPSAAGNGPFIRPKIRLSYFASIKSFILSYRWAWSYFQRFIMLLFVVLSVIYYIRALVGVFRQPPPEAQQEPAENRPQEPPVEAPLQNTAAVPQTNLPEPVAQQNYPAPTNSSPPNAADLADQTDVFNDTFMATSSSSSSSGPSNQHCNGAQETNIQQPMMHHNTSPTNFLSSPASSAAPQPTSMAQLAARLRRPLLTTKASTSPSTAAATQHDAAEDPSTLPSDEDDVKPPSSNSTNEIS